MYFMNTLSKLSVIILTIYTYVEIEFFKLFHIVLTTLSYYPIHFIYY